MCIKIIYSLLLITLLNSAESEIPLNEDKSHKKARNWWNNMPKWKGRFPLHDGTIIEHEEDGIYIIPNTVQDFNEENQKHQEIYLEEWNGKHFKRPLYLKIHSSRNDFIIELIKSGLYEGTLEEQIMYRNSSKWAGAHTVVGLKIRSPWDGKFYKCRTITHESCRLTFADEFGNVIDHAGSIRLLYDKKEIYLETQLSHYEFMSRLIETRHVSFMEYPPYITQGRSRIEFGREYYSYEYYYYGDIPASADPLYESKKQDELIHQEQKLIYKAKLEQRKKREEERLQMKCAEEKKLLDYELLTGGEQCKSLLDPLKTRETRVTFSTEPQEYISTHTPKKAPITIEKPRIPSTTTCIGHFLSYIASQHSRVTSTRSISK